MPFKSEAQRKYLWANEPEIARDWTDTYGSGIKAAQGGRIGFYKGSDRHAGTGSNDNSAADRANAAQAQARARTSHHPGADTPGFTPTRVTVSKPDYRGNENLDRGGIRSFLADTRSKIMPKITEDRAIRELKRRRVNKIDSEEDLWASQTANPHLDYNEKDINRITELQDYFDGGKGNFNLTQDQYYDIFPKDKPIVDTGGGGEGGQIPWWLRQQAPVDAVDNTATQTASTLGSGHFQVPLAQVLNQTRAADGGMIGSVGGISRPKYQQGNMVGAEMEGAEMEGAMMQSQEVIKELYDALIAQGLSPQAAIEKIKEIIASSQAQEPQSPMMGEEFPGQEFGRAPAAFGGIMDTYTGRRKYGLGSFIKKAVGKVKKLASSKLGKLALMYAAGTYLGGTQFMSGQAGGMGTFAERLRNPKTLANLLKTQQWGTAGTTAAGTTAGVTAANVAPVKTSYGSILTGKDALKAADVVKKGTDWSKYILPASLAAGAYTKYAPLEELDDSQSKWDEDKAWWDNYYAGLGGDYRVPENLRAAEGGRIGRQEGGLMNLGGMEKDYRNDGGFVPLGGEEKADDVPARLSRNEFVFTADAVRNAGGGDIDRGAEVMENVMKNLEAGGQVSEESQGQGAQEMFETSERLSEVI